MCEQGQGQAYVSRRRNSPRHTRTSHPTSPSSLVPVQTQTPSASFNKRGSTRGSADRPTRAHSIRSLSAKPRTVRAIAKSRNLLPGPRRSSLLPVVTNPPSPLSTWPMWPSSIAPCPDPSSIPAVVGNDVNGLGSESRSSITTAAIRVSACATTVRSVAAAFPSDHW